jgi:SAM-dependent methyltransferase
MWASGAAYEQYVGRWSRLVARDFLAWLGVSPDASWLDVGCGSGALSETILALAEPARVEGVDSSPAYIECARDRVADSRARFVLGDAQQLPQSSASCDAVVSGLVLNFVPRPEAALAEMVRVIRPGGVVAAYVWDYADRMQLMRYFWDAALVVDPAAKDLDEGHRFPICRPDALDALWRGTGLERVESCSIDVPTRFEDFDDYWKPFLGGQGPAPSFAMSLDEERRARLRDQLRAALPIAADGSIDLIARAWAVRGWRAW